MHDTWRNTYVAQRRQVFGLRLEYSWTNTLQSNYLSMLFSSTKTFRKLMCTFFTLHLFLNVISVHFFRLFNQTYPICHVYAHDQPWLQNLPLHWTFLRSRSSFCARVPCVSMAVIVVLQSFCQPVRLLHVSLLMSQLRLQADSLMSVTMTDDGVQVDPFHICLRFDVLPHPYASKRVNVPTRLSSFHIMGGVAPISSSYIL